MSNSPQHAELVAQSARFVGGLDLRVGQKLSIEAIGPSSARAAMHDLESKYCEGDLGVVRLHDAKDFSHGRFMSVLAEDHRTDPIVLFSEDASPSMYASELQNALADRRENRLLLLRTQETGVLTGLDLLLQTQYLVRDTAKILGVDISRPGKRIPEDGLRLYKWQ